MPDRPRLAPGEQPYDRLQAVRIGAITGGVIGAVPAAFLRGGFAILIAVGAVLGAVAGKLWSDRVGGTRHPDGR